MSLQTQTNQFKDYPSQHVMSKLFCVRDNLFLNQWSQLKQKAKWYQMGKKNHRFNFGFHSASYYMFDDYLGKPETPYSPPAFGGT